MLLIGHRDDIRIFDTEGELVMVSHHPGKNPYEALDPFGVTPLVCSLFTDFLPQYLTCNLHTVCWGTINIGRLL